MSPSGAEVLRQIKSRIDEVDPAAVREQVGNGAVVVDVREHEEWAAGHIPGADHVPKSYLESRIEGAVPDRDQHVILYCASGNRSAWAARTLIEDLGYENVESMTGGFTLWKDRGYEVETPRTLTAEQRERYSRHLLLPEVGIEGQQKLLDAKVLLLGAGGLGSPAALYLAAAGVGTLGIVDNDEVDLSNLQRQVIHSTERIGVPKVDSAEQTINALNPDVKVVKYPLRLGPDNIMEILAPATTSSSTGSTTSRRGTCSTTRRCGCGSRSCRPRSSASRASCRCSSPTTARATAACSRCRRRPSWRRRAAPTACSACCPGTMGLLQATEVIKLILGEGDPLVGRLLMYDALARDRHRGQGPPRPRLPDLLASIPRRSPTTRWACSPTTRRSAPAPTRVPRSRHGDDPDPTGAARRRSAARRSSAPAVVRRRDPALGRRRAPRHPGAAVRRRRRAQPLRQRLPQRRGRPRARRSRHPVGDDDTLVILPAMAGGWLT